MKTAAKKKIDSEAPKAGAPAQQAPVEAPDVKETASGERRSVAWYVDGKGEIDVSRLREKTKTELKQLFSDRALQAKLGITGSASAAQVSLVSPEMVNGLYSMLGSLEVMLAQRFAGASPEIATAAFSFDDEKKKALTPLTVKVANKYAGDWLQKYGDEIMLASLFMSVTISQIATMKNLQAQAAKGQHAPKSAMHDVTIPAPAPATVTSTVAPEIIDAFAEVPAEPTEKLN